MTSMMTSPMSTPVPSDVARFRIAHRAEHIGPRYRGWLHFAVTNLGSLAAIGFAISRVRHPSAIELAMLPVFFVVSNVAEYFGHRGPMHHRRSAAARLFERHTLQHHAFYTHEAMEAESACDFQMVLFPPIMLVFFLGLLAMPIGLVLGLLVAPNLGYLFVANGVSYFLLYEWLHFAYHQPQTSWIGRRWIVRQLRRHHLTHHDPRRMASVNFNVTFPIADRLFGTLASRSPAPAVRQPDQRGGRPAITTDNHTKQAH
jgi:hypothetical protein